MVFDHRGSVGQILIHISIFMVRGRGILWDRVKGHTFAFYFGPFPYPVREVHTLRLHSDHKLSDQFNLLLTDQES
jgi:hypothetical protein